MQKLRTIFLLLCSSSCFAQTSYNLFESFNTEFLKTQNAKIKSVTSFRNLKSGLRKITSYNAFSSIGLPTKIVEYDENSNELRTIDFMYTGFNQPSIINTFKKGKKFVTSEFYYDSTKSLLYFKDYVYSSLSGEKMLLWKTVFEYHNNRKIKRITRMEASDILQKQDSAEIILFDTSGVKTKSYFDMSGFKQYFTYQWNTDKTEMKECTYSGDSIQAIIIHKYKGGHEIESAEKDSNKPPVFWKYDKENRLIQTNASIFVTQNFVYDAKGYLVKESRVANFPELVKDNDYKIVGVTYEYKFRK